MGREKRVDQKKCYIPARRSSKQDDSPDDVNALSMRKANFKKWLVLFAAFLCRMLGEGYANSMGMFFVEFLEYFKSGRGVTGWVVSLTSGIMYGAGIPISFIVYKTNERICCVAGGFVVATGLIASYFATSVYFLLCTFGIVTGIGMAFIQISFAIAVGRHFLEGRGPATAICETGVTIGGLAFPPLLRYLIDTYGWRGAVLISGGILLNIVAFGMLFSQPTVSRTNSKQGDTTGDALKYCDPEIKRTRTFIVYVITAVFVGVGYFFPYGTIVDIGNTYGKQKSTYLVMALSVSNTFGVFIMAGLIKVFYRHISLLHTLNVCLLGISLYVFPVTYSYETLMVAVVLYGLPTGGLYGSYAVVVLDLLGERRYTTGLGFTCSSYGLGMALSTPVAGWINDATGNYEKPFYIAGSVCVGTALVFGASLLFEHCSGHGSVRHSDRATTFELTIADPSTVQQQNRTESV